MPPKSGVINSNSKSKFAIPHHLTGEANVPVRICFTCWGILPNQETFFRVFLRLLHALGFLGR